MSSRRQLRERRRRRGHPLGPWWAREYGGMPLWLIFTCVAGLAALFAIVLVSL